MALRDSALTHDSRVPAGHGGWRAQGAAWGGQGAARQPWLPAQGLVRVVLDGQLQQAARLLDQQVNLQREMMMGWVWGHGGSGAGWGVTGGPYLIQRDVADGGPVDLQDAVTNVDGVLHVGADAVWVHPVGTVGSDPQHCHHHGGVLGQSKQVCQMPLSPSLLDRDRLAQSPQATPTTQGHVWHPQTTLA